MAQVSFISVAKLSELLGAAKNPQGMFLRVLNTRRLVFGEDPLQPTHAIDLSKEEVVPYDAQDQAGSVTAPLSVAQLPPKEFRVARRSGEYWFQIGDERVECTSLKELLRQSLLAFEQRRPGMLNDLSRIKPRSKRIVAHNAHDLFDKVQLAKEYSEQLMPGWWFGTNNSANETRRWLEHACDCAGLKWGKDFGTSLG